MRPISREKITENFGFALHETARLWRHLLDERLKVMGLSQSQWFVLMNLPDTGLKQIELAAMLEVESSTIGRLLDRMEAGGWIKRLDAVNDRRSWRVVPTAKSKKVKVQIRQIATELRLEVLNQISDSKLVICFDVLAELKLTLHNMRHKAHD